MMKKLDLLAIMLIKIRKYIVGFFIGYALSEVDRIIYAGFNKIEFTGILINLCFAWIFSNEKVLAFLLNIDMETPIL